MALKTSYLIEMKLPTLLALSAAICNAQCSMCFRTAAAQQASQAQALNLGILALLVPPIGIMAVILYTAFKRQSTDVE